MNGNTIIGVLYVSWLLGFILKIFFFKTASGTPEVAAFDGGFCSVFHSRRKCSDTGVLAWLADRTPQDDSQGQSGKTWELRRGDLVVHGCGAGIARSPGAQNSAATLMHAAVLGPLMAVGAVVGDLVVGLQGDRREGFRFVFPGIGGILDLLDNLLFNALMFLYLGWFCSMTSSGS